MLKTKKKLRLQAVEKRGSFTWLLLIFAAHKEYYGAREF